MGVMIRGLIISRLTLSKRMGKGKGMTKGNRKIKRSRNRNRNRERNLLRRRSRWSRISKTLKAIAEKQSQQITKTNRRSHNMTVVMSRGRLYCRLVPRMMISSR